MSIIEIFLKYISFNSECLNNCMHDYESSIQFLYFDLNTFIVDNIAYKQCCLS